MIGVSRGPCDAGVLESAPAAPVACAAAAQTRTLAATVLGSSLAFIDGTVVNIALPALQEKMAATIATTATISARCQSGLMTEVVLAPRPAR